MSSHTLARPLVRAGAPLAALAAVALMAAPASAHVTGTPSETAAGAYTVLTMSVPHGCDGSPTTEIEIQVPEPILSVTPTRNPFYDVQVNMQKLDEPVADGHGGEYTERVGTVVYTANEPLPEGQRDTMELSFQIPEDMAGEMLAFPTVQTCEKGETGWVEVPEEGQSAEELESPAPSFEVTEASEEGHHGDEASAEEASDESAEATTETQEASTEDSSMLGWTGVVLGALGLLVGGVALARSRKSA
ncbi:YcnI family copper-binding membrane protein [Nocardioides sp. GXQ0305]|uniref:YcnI family copper-binding membrane protein n=1 Tax=Nocardioides sp. GXQ0305 TaxID=3423912 RepID=UPI003D7CBCEE